MKNSILIEISLGELVDRITILELKVERIKAKIKNKSAKIELSSLKSIFKKNVSTKNLDTINPLVQNLRDTNSKLWDLENEIRFLDQNNDFDDYFINIAKQIYRNNDLRFNIKTIINQKINSDLIECKEYTLRAK